VVKDPADGDWIVGGSDAAAAASDLARSTASMMLAPAPGSDDEHAGFPLVGRHLPGDVSTELVTVATSDSRSVPLW
jgi:hypothetical protein